MTRWLNAFLPVVLWMSIIFIGSTDLGSSQRTSRIIGPILRWFNPEVSDETIRALQAVVRKSAHVCVYALLALLIWRARRVIRRVGVENFTPAGESVNTRAMPDKRTHRGAHPEDADAFAPPWHAAKHRRTSPRRW